MNRIEKTFEGLKARRATGLITFTTVGFPTVDSTLRIVPALAEAGADLIELGVPFSDPLADGATIQRASFTALQNGVTLRTCLDVSAQLRRKLPLVPLVLMGYYNPVLHHGLQRFAEDAVRAGVDGVIVPDLPPEEAEPLSHACATSGLDLIFFLAPTSTEERIAKVASLARGFIYCVSLTGVTGARSELPATLPDFLKRVRQATSLPLAVGFGVSTREQVETIGAVADAVIVGSALLNTIERASPGQQEEQARRFVASLKQGAYHHTRS